MHISSSLIISTYNWPEALDLCLKSVLDQHQLPDEIIIADDGSGDETRALIQRYQNDSPKPIKHVWHSDEGFRKTIILNTAVKEAKGAYLIQIDGDIIVHPEFVRDHLSVAKQGQFIRGSRAMLDSSTTRHALQVRRTHFGPFSKGVKHRLNALHIPALSSFIRTDPYNPADVKGCNMAYWKSDFVLVNGYNNDLTGWGHEDIELAARFVNNGIRKRHLKWAAVCFHIDHPHNSRANESANKAVYERMLSSGTKQCTNGYNSTLNQPQ